MLSRSARKRPVHEFDPVRHRRCRPRLQMRDAAHIGRDVFLRDRKLANLEATGAQEYVSANVGCISHLQSGTATPVGHWIELVDRALA